MIASDTRLNHNETLVADTIELSVEEVEELIAPGWRTNHDETVEVDLAVEGLEEVVAPGYDHQHNETLLSE